MNPNIHNNASNDSSNERKQYMIPTHLPPVQSQPALSQMMNISHTQTYGQMMNMAPTVTTYIQQLPPMPTYNTMNALPTYSALPLTLTLPPNIYHTHYPNAQFYGVINPLQPNNDLTLHNQSNDIPKKSQSAPNKIPIISKESQPKNESVDFVENSNKKSSKNPWFNDEIALIVKEHRKASRKYHRSKTKKEELKQIFKALDKKKRKLIKAAKQKYLKDVAMNKQTEEMNEESVVVSDDTSGYIALCLVQSIGGIWRQWTAGKHWKVDVDDILDDNNDDGRIEIVEWVKDIKTEWFAGKHWKVDIDELLQSTKATQELHLVQLFGFIRDGIVAYYKYQCKDPLL